MRSATDKIKQLFGFHLSRNLALLISKAVFRLSIIEKMQEKEHVMEFSPHYYTNNAECLILHISHSKQ
jgi:hypothetical protein